MHNPQRFLAAFSVAAAAATAAQAQTIDQIEQWQKQNQFMERSIEMARSSCGVPIRFEFDTSSWEKDRASWAKASPNGLCSTVVEAVAQLCGSSEAAKKVVASRLKGVRCGLGKWNPGLVAGGTLRVTLDADAPNVADKTVEFLKKNL